MIQVNLSFSFFFFSNIFFLLYLGSIYITPVPANHPAIQYNSSVKGWLRKQNRDSFLKRIERYYCVLANNALLMHRHDHDTTPYKAINLKG
jgi:hypothetical protein